MKNKRYGKRHRASARLAWLKERVMKLRFRKKLVLTYLIVTLIPMFALGWFTYHMTTQMLNRQLDDMLSFNTRQLATSVGTRLEKNNEFIRFTAFSPYLMEEFTGQPKNWYSISQKISNYFEPVAWYNMVQNADFESLHIYFEYLDQPIGTFIAPAENVRGQEWYDIAQASQNTHWYFADGRLFAARRVYNATKDLLLGAVHMEIDIDHIVNSLIKTRDMEFGLVLADADGQLLYASQNAAFADDDFTRLLSAGPGRVQLGGQSYYAAHDTVPDFGWSVYTYVPYDNYAGQKSQLVLTTVLLLGFCAVVLLGLIWLFSTTMVKRLESLNDQMSRVTGDYNRPVTQAALKDEIGTLEESFGTLVNEVYKGELIQKEGELKALQAQINPHFLYNTLSLINCKAIETDNDEISAITGLISTFYRTCLNKGESLISIRDEISNIKAYVDLQLIMHDDGFGVEYDIDEAVYKHPTVNFTLQPIVENAILHGIDENENAAGHLVIRARLTDTGVEFTVEDNGVGMSNEKINDLFTRGTGSYGIRNVDQRIKLYFGEEYGVHIYSKPGESTVAILHIPAR